MYTVHCSTLILLSIACALGAVPVKQLEMRPHFRLSGKLSIEILVLFLTSLIRIQMRAAELRIRIRNTGYKYKWAPSSLFPLYLIWYTFMKLFSILVENYYLFFTRQVFLLIFSLYVNNLPTLWIKRRSLSKLLARVAEE